MFKSQFKESIQGYKYFYNSKNGIFEKMFLLFGHTLNTVAIFLATSFVYLMIGSMGLWCFLSVLKWVFPSLFIIG